MAIATGALVCQNERGPLNYPFPFAVGAKFRNEVFFYSVGLVKLDWWYW